jgi:hypothetical protein
MKFPNGLEQLSTDRTVRRVYGEPYQTQDGVTVIPAGEPLGVFVVHGVITGLLAAVIASLAVLRQPPWPRITITDYR